MFRNQLTDKEDREPNLVSLVVSFRGNGICVSSEEPENVILLTDVIEGSTCNYIVQAPHGSSPLMWYSDQETIASRVSCS